MPPDARPLDLVVWGATGFTGRLVARAVAERAPAGLRWALGGRDRTRLEALRDELGTTIGVVTADAEDPPSLAAMARDTRAIVTTVGPYAKRGTPLVAACAEAGTDHADLAAEPLWMRETIDAFHERARASGARIVHACGFDSVPADLGTWLLQGAAIARHGRPCREVLHVFGPMFGGVSGGTIASLLDVAERGAGDPEARRALLDPDLLAPGAPPSGPRRDPKRPERHEGIDGWTAPFPLATANEQVVRRTRALLGEPWGDAFAYRERLLAGTWARAALASGAVAAAAPLLALGPVRSVLRRLAPSPGDGPPAFVRRRGFFRSRLVGRVEGVTRPLVATVAADVDPGYGASSRMLAEVGLGLALGEFEAPGGVLTPAAVGDGRLVERLTEVGIHLRAEVPGR